MDLPNPPRSSYSYPRHPPSPPLSHLPHPQRRYPLLERPLFSTLKLADMVPGRAARRKFSQWRLARRILVYDADSAIHPDGSNVIGLLRKFRANICLIADAQPSGDQPTSPGSRSPVGLRAVSRPFYENSRPQSRNG